jgi:uncharacterized protein YsxB (DUF464 family)
MITAHFFLNDQQHIWGYHIDGHADYAAAGTDIVCSAVSVYAINTANSLEQLVGLQPKVDSAEGRFLCELPAIRDGSLTDDRAELLFRSMEQGLRSVAYAYGKEYLDVLTYQKA